MAGEEYQVKKYKRKESGNTIFSDQLVINGIRGISKRMQFHFFTEIIKVETQMIVFEIFIDIRKSSGITTGHPQAGSSEGQFGRKFTHARPGNDLARMLP